VLICNNNTDLVILCVDNQFVMEFFVLVFFINIIEMIILLHMTDKNRG
jgi:hypothetical protein